MAKTKPKQPPKRKPGKAKGYLAVAALLAVSACSAIVAQPANPKVTAEIVKACLYSGLFKTADGMLTMAVPAASLPVSVINAGVDRVCAAPEKYAADISTIEWVVKNTRR